MRYLFILDTNVLIDLCDPNRYKSWVSNILFDKLHSSIHLLIPKVAKDEWEILRDDRYTTFKENMIKPLEKAKNISGNFRNKDEKSQYEISIENVIKYRKREFEYTYGRKFRFIQRQFDGKLAHVPEMGRASKILVADMAFRKDPPFFSSADPRVKKESQNKNEATDAYIFFSAYDFIIKNKLHQIFQRIYFITNNTNDFSSFEDKSKIHENLEVFTERANITFSINLEGVLKELFPSEDFSEVDEMAEAHKYLSDKYFIDCINEDCDGELHINRDGFWGNFGFWNYQCLKCNHIWKSSDRIEDRYN